MRLLEAEREEQRQSRSVAKEEHEELARRLRRKMRVHPGTSVARAASASPVLKSDIKPAA
jgi:uncharacterized protein with von Willebrand factor type A (vWA) domain